MVMDDINLAKEINQISKDLSPLKIVIDHCFMLNSVRKTEETLDALDFLSKNQNIFANAAKKLVLNILHDQRMEIF